MGGVQGGGSRGGRSREGWGAGAGVEGREWLGVKGVCRAQGGSKGVA